MRMKQQLALFVFLFVLSVLTMSTALAIKPGVPWHVTINALEVESAQVEVTVVIEGYADVPDLIATVTSNNAILLKGDETWNLAVHKGKSVVTSLRYRYLPSAPAPQWKVMVSGSQQYASMSQIAITRLVKNKMQKSESSQSRVRKGAEEYRSH